MRLEELYKHYGTYAEMTRRLGLGSTTYLGWVEKGYIPFPTQCIIEVKTNRLFKANKDHEKPKN